MTRCGGGDRLLIGQRYPRYIFPFLSAFFLCGCAWSAVIISRCYHAKMSHEREPSEQRGAAAANRSGTARAKWDIVVVGGQGTAGGVAAFAAIQRG